MNSRRHVMPCDPPPGRVHATEGRYHALDKKNECFMLFARRPNLKSPFSSVSGQNAKNSH